MSESDTNGQTPGTSAPSNEAPGSLGWGGLRRKTSPIAGLKSLVKPPKPVSDEICDLCGLPIPSRHRHLLHLEERRICCVCATCWALRSGDAAYRPTGNRVLWLDDFNLPDELWASFGVPIGLCFFFHSGTAQKIIGLYPSPAGATECELYLDAWDDLKRLNPILETLQVDVEALIINRLTDPPQYSIAPVDQAYELVGLIKSKWEGISGGPALKAAVEEYFEGLKQEAAGW
ncbi:MAG TPA: DUF5947 family protein [Actinomycetota bacterium]|nr:DUF5947 family protein [Actinomycetota bacterium]